MLDIGADAATLTAQLIDVESVSGNEARLADLVETALRAVPALTVHRDGNVVLARTTLGRPQRIVLAGHVDTVPVAGNLPSHRDGGRLYGCGSSDMKAGVAVMLRVAHAVATGVLDPRTELSFVAYDCEEIEAARNGLGRIAREQPEVLRGDLAVVLEPTAGVVEGGCQGTMRAQVRTTGVRAHSARSWLGRNAIHAAGEALRRLEDYTPRVVELSGLTYREGLNAVAISGGVAGNIIPDECIVTVNYRFAPDRSVGDAQEHLREVFAGYEVEITDAAPAAPPGLDAALAAEFVAAVGQPPRAKLGWTDAARFAELGVPALNFGPGDPDLAHKPQEYVEVDRIHAAEAALLAFLS
ncbi:MAG TPA: succinyl-diaminopimelate desuccinylase [Jatrophihabitantaceae bacterium]